MRGGPLCGGFYWRGAIEIFIICADFSCNVIVIMYLCARSRLLAGTACTLEERGRRILGCRVYGSVKFEWPLMHTNEQIKVKVLCLLVFHSYVLDLLL
ncbi:hypothetical protein DM02DRAFT_12538 [Periconia macrospinosa]|uniref:Uncharacterized protein n=1 Tax=Periconia macrospinosa TaxID=97972 RepID=A0A2V1EDZ1_9PLEO|nr:hypothetical protein DM02DRAFT_12538 [Periconia macrospinosa]